MRVIQSARTLLVRVPMVIGAIALALPTPFVFAAPAAAAPSGGSAPVVQFCKQDVPNTPGAHLGDCVGFINTFASDSQGLIRFECDFLQRFEPDVFYASYDTYQECIVDRASELPPPPY